MALERRLHMPAARADRAILGVLLDVEFAEIGASGRCYTRAQMLRHLPDEAAEVHVEAERFVVRRLAPGLAQVRYRSRYLDARGEPGAWAERSSLWRGGDAGWRLLFHQATPAARQARDPRKGGGPAG